MFVKDFMPEETFQVAVDLAGKDFSAKVYEQEFSTAFRDRCSLGCFVSGTNELVGVDTMRVKSRDEKEEPEVRLGWLLTIYAAALRKNFLCFRRKCTQG